MRRMEITLQIEKHRAIVKKYNTVSGVVGYLKFIMIPLAFIALCFVFISGIPAELFIIGVLAIVALWTYHNKVRRILSSSGEIIDINKRLLNDLPGNRAPYISDGTFRHEDISPEPGMEASFQDYVEHFYARKNAESSALYPDTGYFTEAIPAGDRKAVENPAIEWDEKGAAPNKKAIRFLLM